MDETWNPLFTTTVTAHQQSDHASGMEACERLLSAVGIPEAIEQQTRRNQTFYLEPLAATGSVAFREPPYVKSREIRFPVREGWSRFNPSIAANPEGDLAIIVRSSNYTMRPDMFYDYPDWIKTENYVGKVLYGEGHGKYRYHHPQTGFMTRIEDQHLLHDPPPFPVSGIEDCRLFWHDDGWKFSGTMRELHPSGTCQMVMGDLIGRTASNLTILSGRQRHEKNWMPIDRSHWNIVGPTAPAFITICHPTMRLSVMSDGDASGGTFTTAPWIARFFRGGSQLISLDLRHRYLAVIHEAVDVPGSLPARVYSHRFVEFLETVGRYRITRVSPPFSFHGRGGEFAGGMVLVEDDLIISYGTNDAQAWLFKMPLEQALGMLKEPYPEEL